MGVQEEAGMASGSDDTSGAAERVALLGLAAGIVKGKRTKRQRVHAPPVAAPAMIVESSSVAEASPSRSGAEEAASGCVTEEEEDMAHCLMLLAQGHGRLGSPKPETAVDVKEGGGGGGKELKFRSRRRADGGEGGGKPGEYVYECKTCNKCFPSFQALGGHRASHKKPRLLPPPSPAMAATADPASEDKKSVADAEEEKLPISMNPISKSMASQAHGSNNNNSNSKPRIHECSICGSEFTSGQALGGHMRRHRPLVAAGTEAASATASASASAQEDGSGGGHRKEKSLLELDLNLPAPCDDGTTDMAAEPQTSTTSPPAFVFAASAATERTLLFPASASALVDCHY